MNLHSSIKKPVFNLTIIAIMGASKNAKAANVRTIRNTCCDFTLNNKNLFITHTFINWASCHLSPAFYLYANFSEFNSFLSQGHINKTHHEKVLPLKSYSDLTILVEHILHPLWILKRSIWSAWGLNVKIVHMCVWIQKFGVWDDYWKWCWENIFKYGEI